MAIASPDKHHLAQGTAFENLPRLAERPVVAMVEAYAHHRSGASGGLGHRIQFASPPGARLLYQYVLSDGYCFGSDECELIVGRSDEYRVHVRAPHRGPPVGRGYRPMWRGQLRGALLRDIAANRHRPGRECGRATWGGSLY